MKLLNHYILLLFAFALVFSSCQPEEVAPSLPTSRQPPPIKKTPTPLPGTIPPNQVIRTDYAGATKWRIIYTNVDVNLGSLYQRYFSTVDGSFQSLSELNSSTSATARADMNLMFWFIASPDKFNHQLTFPAHAAATRFKPSEWPYWQLPFITLTDPAQFEAAFEGSMFESTPYQPYNYELNGDESDYINEGDIYFFKTDRTPARYGAVSILVVANPFLGTEQTIIEITVQADNNIVQLND